MAFGSDTIYQVVCRNPTNFPDMPLQRQTNLQIFKCKTIQVFTVATEPPQ